MSNSNNKTKSKKNQYKHLTIDDRACSVTIDVKRFSTKKVIQVV